MHTEAPFISDAPLVNWNGLIGVFSTGVFAQLVNFGVHTSLLLLLLSILIDLIFEPLSLLV
jgi:hypothetical protein